MRGDLHPAPRAGGWATLNVAKATDRCAVISTQSQGRALSEAAWQSLGAERQGRKRGAVKLPFFVGLRLRLGLSFGLRPQAGV